MENIDHNQRQGLNEDLPRQTDEINKKYGVPALISFFIPGVGQLIKGHIGKAFLIWLLIVGAFLLFIIGGVSTQQGDDSKAILTLLGFVALVAIFFWNIYDAYNSN